MSEWQRQAEARAGLGDGQLLRDRVVQHGRGVKVVVTVDCGIASVGEAEEALRLGMDLVITDPHEPDADLPPAFAVINPKRRDCLYPDKYLAGVGVALIPELALSAVREDILIRTPSPQPPLRQLIAAVPQGARLVPAAPAMLGILERVAQDYATQRGRPV